MNWYVSMIGAREHYALPRMLNCQQKLAAFETDLWAGPWRKLPGIPKSLAGRWHGDLAGVQVKSSAISFIRDQQNLRRCRGSRRALYTFYAEQGACFARRVAKHLPQDGEGFGFLGFQSAALETMQIAKERGMKVVLDQTDPAQVEEEWVREEQQAWPGWQKSPEQIPKPYVDRLQAEWAIADRVIVNSEWSRKALVAQGVDAEKLRVVPLGFENGHGEMDDGYGIKKKGWMSADQGEEEQRGKREEGRPLRVLWLGTVNLRKGIPYLVEAARRLKSHPIEFKIAGPLEIDLRVVKAPDNMNFVGRIQRSEAKSCYAWADVFVLPTISDGFAITQLEAMAQGLPVLTTPHCGEVVRDGVDGRVIPVRDVDALVTVLGEWEANRGLVAEMGVHALERVKDFSLANVGDVLRTSLSFSS